MSKCPKNWTSEHQSDLLSSAATFIDYIRSQSRPKQFDEVTVGPDDNEIRVRLVADPDLITVHFYEEVDGVEDWFQPKPFAYASEGRGGFWFHEHEKKSAEIELGKATSDQLVSELQSRGMGVITFHPEDIETAIERMSDRLLFLYPGEHTDFQKAVRLIESYEAHMAADDGLSDSLTDWAEAQLNRWRNADRKAWAALRDAAEAREGLGA